MKKLEGTYGDAGPDEIASWPYVDKLQFFKNHFTQRQSSGNLNTLKISDVPLHNGQDHDVSFMSDDARENLFQLPTDT